MDRNVYQSSHFMEESDDDIVISGISGRFGSANNIEEFFYCLSNKIDLCDDSEKRFKHKPGLPRRTSKVNGLEFFDAEALGTTKKLADIVDPTVRCLMEHAYECVLDAGLNPMELRGINGGVYSAKVYMESTDFQFHNDILDLNDPSFKYQLLSDNRAVSSSRISYVLDFRGPCFTVDSACSSSIVALTLAYNAIKHGECDCAIVGCDNTTLLPKTSYGFVSIGITSKDGYCRPFDEKASGFVRGEAISTIFLQKRKNANRVYATILHSKLNNDGYKEKGLMHPVGEIQMELMKNVYKEIHMDPCLVSFVEAHGTGTVAGDPEECKGIYEVFCKNRKKPLLIGSVKSNLGHTEAAAAVSSLIKVLLSFEGGKILPNLYFDEPRKEILPLVNGDLKVVTELTDVPGPFAAISSFGIGGTNGHTVVKRHEKPKINQGIPADGLPRLLCWSGRTEQACYKVFDGICKRPLDAELIALLQTTQTSSNPTYMYKGYGIFTQEGYENAKCIASEVIFNTEPSNRPVVWVFSGMGSQWVTMGTSLMALPVFRQAIEKCHNVLKTKNVDLIEILTSNDKTMFENILHSFVGIAAVQIGLVDVLRQLDLEPDFYIGHSVGELGCAYADGCMTAEEMILCSYSRGVASLETKVVFGTMAAVGLGYQQIKSMLPTGIEVACHNGPDSCTISGPADLVAKFVNELVSKGIFAKEVPCSNIPYHSSHIAEMGPNLLKRLKVITKPVKRSPKWLCTSVPKENWDTPEAQMSTAEYHTNNLLSPVLFEETVNYLPENAITVEIAPHGLLQAILKRSMPNATHISLTRRNSTDNLIVFLTSLGKIYNQKIKIPVSKLYPPVSFPVSAGTPSISSLIEWDHSEIYSYTKFDFTQHQKTKHTFKFDLNQKDQEYIAGHTIDGRVLFPATGYLYLAWTAFANMYASANEPHEIPVEITDVKFVRTTTLRKGESTKFTVVVQPLNGNFEISESEALVASGCIKALEENKINTVLAEIHLSGSVLLTNDFYKELKLRGYHYSGEFQSVLEAKVDGSGGKVKWLNNFVSFMDCMLQLAIIGTDSRMLMVPTGIKRIRIDAQKFLNSGFKTENDIQYANVVFSSDLKLIQTPGIEMYNMTTNVITRRKLPAEPVLESYQFLPYHLSERMSAADAIRVFVQLSIENVPLSNMKVLEMNSSTQLNPLIMHVQSALEGLPKITGDYSLITDDENLSLTNIQIQSQLDAKAYKDLSLFLTNQFCSNQNHVQFIQDTCEESVFIVSREALDFNPLKVSLGQNLSVVSSIPVDEELFVLIFYNNKPNSGKGAVVKVSNTDSQFTWLDDLKNALKSGKTYVVAQREPDSGVIGLVNCLRREPKQEAFCVFIDDPNAPAFDQEALFYKSQLEKGMIINVYRGGQWGHYRHVLLKPSPKTAPQPHHYYANVLRRGDLSSLTWFNGPLDIEQDEVVKILYSSLNFRDVMVATGKIDLSQQYTRFDADCMLGLEFSGVTKSGRRIMGMNSSACLATYTVANMKNCIFDVPDKWSLEEAATVPTVYSTVYAALFVVTQVEKGRSILIHAGTGGVGLAAIRVALAYGLEVFTTVSTNEKKNYLLSLYPELKPNHIGNSRDTSFYNMIMLQTKGHGVHYVLNSLADDKLTASLDCLAEDGHFIEIGKYDILNDSKLGLRAFEKGISFHSVMLDRAMQSTNQTMMMRLHDLIQKDINRGIIKPLKRTVFNASEIQDAFRFLASGKHMGKVLLKIHEDENARESLPLNVTFRTYFNPNLVYVIPGGLGGFGLELADWMILRGSRKLVLSSSKGISKGYQAYRINLWKSYGVNVVVNTDDISTYEGCMKLINYSESLGPIGGIFNLAVLLRDSIFENQNVQKFTECFAVKAYATQHLDEISRKHCPKLEHFVIFSSVSCGRGNAGQTNYGMANSIMERIIEKRVADGLPGKAIEWGAVGDVGLVADLAENKIDMEIGGTLLQRISSCLEVLDIFFAANDPVVASMVVAEKKVVVAASIIDTVCNILGIKDIKTVSMDQKLSEFGLDSLMAVEVKEVIEQALEITISPQELRNLTFQILTDLTKKKDLKSSNESRKGTNIASILENFSYESSSDVTFYPLNDHKLIKKQAPILIVPGIEGVMNKTWIDLGKMLKRPAFLLQLIKSKDLIDLGAITDMYFNDIMKHVVKDSNTFFIVGHSFGTLIALECVRRLEKLGLTGHLVLIEGTPKYLHRNSSTEGSQSHNMNLLDIFRSFLTEMNVSDIFVPNFSNDIIDKIFEINGNAITVNKNYLKSVSQGIVSRTKILQNLVPDEFKKLKSDILLIKCVDQLVSDIEDDYGAKACTTGSVTVKVVKGNHTTVLKQMEIAEILNTV